MLEFILEKSCLFLLILAVIYIIAFRRSERELKHSIVFKIRVLIISLIYEISLLALFIGITLNKPAIIYSSILSIIIGAICIDITDRRKLF